MSKHSKKKSFPMIYRKFNAPNVEYNEIDRSQYGLINDGAAIGTMTFIAGFADKGDDYDAKYSRSLPDFINTYGYPTNEAERYFYNAAKEVFSKGGRTITSKIPYDNESKDKFAFTIYQSDAKLSTIDYKGKFADLSSLDPSITSYIELKSVEKDNLSTILSTNFPSIDRTCLMTMEQYDDLLVGKVKPNENTLYIIDISRNRYSKDPNVIDLSVNQTDSYLGYVPVLVSPLNALYFQNLISANLSDDTDENPFNVAKNFQTIPNTGLLSVSEGSGLLRMNELPELSVIESHLALPIESSEIVSETVSKIAASYFPSIRFYSENRLDRTYLKQIGIVVFRMVSDTSNDGRINFIPVESFVGSLNRKAKDPITGKNLFIDNIVNDNSEFINVFSNFKFEQDGVVRYNNNNDDVKVLASSVFDKASTYLISNQTITSLGFFVSQCAKYISKETIEKTLDLIFENCKDPNLYPLDIICDGGVSNIAQYMDTLQGKTVFYEPEYDFDGQYSLRNAESTKVWKQILKKYDDFVKYMRKDCIFIADGMRPLCLTGNEKIIRKSAPKNTIVKNLIPKIRYMLPPNSSYSAGYCDWFKCVDDTSQSYFWCPPSIKALGVYLYTDRYANTWDAPAGDNRGKIEDAYDIAFNPTIEEAQSFYEQQWNYAMSYPLNGIVLEGQKTFQTERTALDRVNVRRLCNGIKKGIREIARWFKYEGITPHLLTRFRDQLTEFLQKVQVNDGISEFFIKLDEENNTPETIDRNEIHATIAIRPVKTAEFIIINAIVVNQSADLEEVTNSVLA